MEPERFDDVGFEFLEVPDTSRRPRPRRRLFALGVLACSLAALAAAAAIAVTPAQAPQPRQAGPGSQSPVEFTGERYPARHGGKGNCPRHERQRSADPAPSL